MRWLLIFLLSFVVFNGLSVWQRRIGLGRLPGDFSVRWRGLDIHVPLAISLVLSVLAMMIGLMV
ncbi:MAG: DUF2905 domain-containing protein [Rubrivivax sp.]